MQKPEILTLTLDDQVFLGETFQITVIPGGAETGARSEAFQRYAYRCFHLLDLDSGLRRNDRCPDTKSLNLNMGFILGCGHNNVNKSYRVFLRNNCFIKITGTFRYTCNKAIKGVLFGIYFCAIFANNKEHLWMPD